MLMNAKKMETAPDLIIGILTDTPILGRGLLSIVKEQWTDMRISGLFFEPRTLFEIQFDVPDVIIVEESAICSKVKAFKDFIFKYKIPYLILINDRVKEVSVEGPNPTGVYLSRFALEQQFIESISKLCAKQISKFQKTNKRKTGIKQKNTKTSTEILRQAFQLSNREVEICQWIYEAYSNEDIGKELGISPHTVLVHRRNIMRKMGVHNALSMIRKIEGILRIS
jgi:DNA-binding CsgD family transcriptional regulator